MVTRRKLIFFFVYIILSQSNNFLDFYFLWRFYISSTRYIHFQNFLDAFTEAAESVYGCLFIDGKVAVATKKWWSLSANELVLLSLLLSSLTPCTSRDIPVYLPDSHPTVWLIQSCNCTNLWNNTPTQPPYFSLLLHCVSLIFVSFNFVDVVKITVLRAHEFVTSDSIKKNNSKQSEIYQQGGGGLKIWTSCTFMQQFFLAILWYSIYFIILITRGVFKELDDTKQIWTKGKELLTVINVYWITEIWNPLKILQKLMNGGISWVVRNNCSMHSFDCSHLIDFERITVISTKFGYSWPLRFSEEFLQIKPTRQH